MKTQGQTNNTKNTLAEEIKEIHRSFKKLESEIVAVTKVNVLVKQLNSVGRHCWKNAQYSRWECVEVVGIPSSVEHDRLDPTVCRILRHIEVNISVDKIEACHWLDKNSYQTIVKLSSRNDCEHRMPLKKYLKDLDATDLDLPAGTKLYINDNVSLLPRIVEWSQKNVEQEKKNFFFTVCGTGCKRRVHIVL